jgi:hypothetical protein
MNPNRLVSPRLAQYLDGLPHQLESYPSAVTRADFSVILRRQLAPFLTEANLSHSLRSILCAPWKEGDWIPTTTYAALCAIARDHLWQSEPEYHRGMFDVATEMYKSPSYRLLFFMFGPSIVAMSSAKRWDTLHRGTQLVIKKQKQESINLTLTFPKNLFSETAVQSLGAAFCAIAQGSRGKDPTFTLLSLSDLEAEILISWTY